MLYPYISVSVNFTNLLKNRIQWTSRISFRRRLLCLLLLVVLLVLLLFLFFLLLFFLLLLFLLSIFSCFCCFFCCNILSHSKVIKTYNYNTKTNAMTCQTGNRKWTTKRIETFNSNNADSFVYPWKSGIFFAAGYLLQCCYFGSHTVAIWITLVRIWIANC